MMEGFLITVVEISATTSVLILLLKILSRFLNKRYFAKWKNILWLLIAIRLLIPYNISLSNALVEVQVPKTSSITQVWKQNVTENIQVVEKDLIGQDAEDINNTSKISNKTKISGNKLVVIIWILGCLLFLSHQFVRHQVFKRKVMRWSRLCKDTWMIELEKQLVVKMGAGKVPPIRICEETISPSIMGMFHPVLLLPNNEYSVKELTFILRHELVHYKRCDIWYKLFILIVNSIHWFNPFVWLMRHESNVDLELSCDDEVINGTAIEERKAYSETIFACIHQQKERRSALTTYFFGGTKTLKERFENILSLRKKRNGSILVIVLMVIIFGIGSFIVFTDSNKENPVSEILEQDNEVTAEVSNNIENSSDLSDSEPTDIINTQEFDKNYIDTEQVEAVIINDHNSVYLGNIGTQNISMAIYRDGEQLTASYITQNEEDGEINLRGTVQINTASFILYSEDNDTIFTGTIKPDTEEGELLEGTYTSSKNEAETPFTLARSHTIGITLETRYPLTTSNTEDVEEFVRKIKKYVKEDNKEGLAELINYPIRVHINGTKVTINNAEEFEQNYDDIMNAEFKEKISNSFTKYMNSNYMGIMIGNGQMWFDNWKDKGLRIYAINN